MNPRSAKSASTVAPLAVLCLALALVFSSFAVCDALSAPAAPVSQSGSPVSAPAHLIAGNYCISCHDTADPRLAHAADWRGSPAVTPSPCPGLQAEDEQLYYTERTLHTIYKRNPNSAALPPLYAQYAALLDAPRASTDAFAAQAQLLNYKAGKAYAAVNQSIDNASRLRVLIVALLVTAFLVFAFGWGLRNTLRYQPAKAVLKTRRPGPRTVGVLGVVVVLFALPLFRPPPSAVATSTAEDQAVQTELDKSSRAGAVAERSMARAWMLSQVAATWAQVDREGGEQILSEALAAEAAARDEADALWGRTEAAREASIGSIAGQDKAALVSDELLSVRDRAWPLRLTATEWAAVDPARARQILEQAEAIARANPTVYGQIDLAAISSTWARLDPSRPANARATPSENATAMGPLARTLSLYRASDYAGAWDASLGILDEWERSRAQAAIAEAWGNVDAASKISIPPLRQRATRKITGAADRAPLPATTSEALAAIDQMTTEADKAGALRTLAVSTGDAEVFDRALKMAAAARVRGDALAPARASLALAAALLEKGGSADMAKTALAQAYDLSVKISVKYK